MTIEQLALYVVLGIIILIILAFIITCILAIYAVNHYFLWEQKGTYDN